MKTWRVVGLAAIVLPLWLFDVAPTAAQPVPRVVPPPVVAPRPRVRPPRPARVVPRARPPVVVPGAPRPAPLAPKRLPVPRL